MKHLRIVYLAIGAAILALIAFKTNLSEAWAMTLQIGWGFAVVLALFLVEFIFMSQTWHLTFTSIPQSWRWAYRLWKVRMVGEAFNMATPLAMMGGEPVKALILKKHYGIGYVEGVASLVTSRTTIVIALVVFLASGFALMFGTPSVSPSFRASAGLGLAIFTGAILAFFLVQRFKLFSRTGQLFKRGGVGRFLAQIHQTEDKLIEFYTKRRARFAVACLLALGHWVLGVVTIYYTFRFLGHPVSLTEAWVMEAFTQLVRATTFFIPANIGTQEGAFVVIVSAVTGDPTLGLAVAMVRRGREIVWVVWGLALGWRYLGGRLTPDEEMLKLADTGAEPGT
ncbi:MAG: flippase-like domain-containing protein [Sphingomonadales bacterium]